MDGLIREAQRGREVVAASLLLLLVRFPGSVLSRDLSAGSGKQERETRNEEGSDEVDAYIHGTQEERHKSREASWEMQPGTRQSAEKARNHHQDMRRDVNLIFF